MTAPTPSTPPVSDEQIIRTFRLLTISFCAGPAVILAMVPLALVPDPTVQVRGLVIGVALGAVAWFGSRWGTSAMAARAVRRGVAGVTSTISSVALTGVAVAEGAWFLGLGLVFALHSNHDIGSCVVSVPVAIVAIVMNGSGPGAIRRHLEQLRA